MKSIYLLIILNLYIVILADNNNCKVDIGEKIF